ncbi:type II toxin-antitoxin system VapC family toxin [Algiphilus sp. W345]|uniref:Type II toxin-antitoxin system VapC family toxin n=1 Tax=Banduia mediterranea TaxID=3075609 RepID=A0ABU2WG72_9GAMM|nr:type II toxin-antitoxin system VapC family toxin [Algiphilus sp. W345]MDT0496862.1 type II toxin-antitoxin system VapC family toxin [Algiphilus sp. W345]
MSLLLDTHALLWWFTDDPRLPAKVRDVIADETRPIYVSAVCALEIAVKHRLGKLDEAAEAVSRFDELVAADGFQHLPITHFHCLKAGGYAAPHRDPFDRLLAAQSELEALTLVTRDPALAQFGIRTFW